MKVAVVVIVVVVVILVVVAVRSCNVVILGSILVLVYSAGVRAACW